MGSFSETVRNQFLNAVARNSPFSYAGMWVKLHVGDPGAAGASNPATNSTRQQATFGTAPSGGALSNTATISWSSVPATETYTYASLWSASSGGTFLGSDDLSSVAPVQSGDNFQIAAGDLDLSFV